MEEGGSQEPPFLRHEETIESEAASTEGEARCGSCEQGHDYGRRASNRHATGNSANAANYAAHTESTVVTVWQGNADTCVQR